MLLGPRSVGTKLVSSTGPDPSQVHAIRNYEGKGKIHPRTGHEGPEGSRGITTLPLTSALDGVDGQRHAPANLPLGKRPIALCIGCWMGPRAGLEGCGKSHPHRDFFYQHTFMQVHCVHSSTYVTDTVSIVPEVSVHRTRDIITPPHHRAFPSTSLSYTILVHLAYISLPPHFTLHKSARLTHFTAHVQH